MAHRILVVEDDPTLRLVLRDNLQTEGYNVEVAADGASAVKSARTTIPDLIVLDLTLPDHDGFELLPILRSLGQVPIIVLTARIQRNEKLKGLALGADDYITKPFDPAEFLARIRAVLRRVRPSRQPDPAGVCHHRLHHEAGIEWTAHDSFDASRIRAVELSCRAPRRRRAAERVASCRVGISGSRHRHENRRFRHCPDSAKDRRGSSPPTLHPHGAR